MEAHEEDSGGTLASMQQVAALDFHAAVRDALLFWPGTDVASDRRRLTVLAVAAADRAARLRGAGFRPEQVQVVLAWETDRAASEFDGLGLSPDRVRTGIVARQIRYSIGEVLQPTP